MRSSKASWWLSCLAISVLAIVTFQGATAKANKISPLVGRGHRPVKSMERELHFIKRESEKEGLIKSKSNITVSKQNLTVNNPVLNKESMKKNEEQTSTKPADVFQTLESGKMLQNLQNVDQSKLHNTANVKQDSSKGSHGEEVIDNVFQQSPIESKNLQRETSTSPIFGSQIKHGSDNETKPAVDGHSTTNSNNDNGRNEEDNDASKTKNEQQIDSEGSKSSDSKEGQEIDEHQNAKSPDLEHQITSFGRGLLSAITDIFTGNENSDDESSTTTSQATDGSQSDASSTSNAPTTSSTSRNSDDGSNLNSTFDDSSKGDDTSTGDTYQSSDGNNDESSSKGSDSSPSTSSDNGESSSSTGDPKKGTSTQSTPSQSSSASQSSDTSDSKDNSGDKSTSKGSDNESGNNSKQSQGSSTQDSQHGSGWDDSGKDSNGSGHNLQDGGSEEGSSTSASSTPSNSLKGKAGSVSTDLYGSTQGSPSSTQHPSQGTTTSPAPSSNTTTPPTATKGSGTDDGSTKGNAEYGQQGGSSSTIDSSPSSTTIGDSKGTNPTDQGSTPVSKTSDQPDQGSRVGNATTPATQTALPGTTVTAGPNSATGIASTSYTQTNGGGDHQGGSVGSTGTQGTGVVSTGTSTQPTNGNASSNESTVQSVKASSTDAPASTGQAFGYANTKQLLLPDTMSTVSSSNEGSQSIKSSSNDQHQPQSTSTSTSSSTYGSISSNNTQQQSNAQSQTPLTASYPSTIVPQGSASSQSSGTVLVAILFDAVLSWSFLATSPNTVAQIFLYMPEIISESVGLLPADVTTIRLQLHDSTDARPIKRSESSSDASSSGRTLYLAYIPTSAADELQAKIKNISSDFYTLPANPVAKSLATHVDPSYDLFQISSVSTANQAASSNTGDAGAASNISLRNALIGVGTALAACIVAFFLWRIWKGQQKRKRRATARSVISRGAAQRGTIHSFGVTGNSLRETWAPSLLEQERVLHGQLAETWEHNDGDHHQQERGSPSPEMAFIGGVVHNQSTTSLGQQDIFADAVSNRSSQDTERSGGGNPQRNTLLSHLHAFDNRSIRTDTSRLTEAQRIQHEYLEACDTLLPGPASDQPPFVGKYQDDYQRPPQRSSSHAYGPRTAESRIKKRESKASLSSVSIGRPEMQCNSMCM